MKKLLSLALLGALGVVGCQASVDVDPHKSTTPGTSSVDKTTVRDANGNVVSQKTEVHKD